MKNGVFTLTKNIDKTLDITIVNNTMNIQLEDNSYGDSEIGFGAVVRIDLDEIEARKLSEFLKEML